MRIDLQTQLISDGKLVSHLAPLLFWGIKGHEHSLDIIHYE